MKTSTFFAVVATAVLSYASPVPEEQSAQGGYPPPGFPGPQPGFAPGPPGFPPAGPAAPGYGAPGIGHPTADPGFGRPPAGGPWGPPPGGPQPWGPPPGGPQPWGPPPGQCPGSCGGGPPHPFFPPPPPPPPGPCPTCFLPPPPPPNGDGCGNGGQVSCCNSDNSGDFLNVLGGSCQLSLLDAPCATHCCQVTQVNEGFSLINIGQLCDLL